MAFLDKYYIFVEDEQVSFDSESTTHPVEQGENITDHIRRQPTALSLKGKIVNHGQLKAAEIVTKLAELQSKGTPITYAGRNLEKNMQIQSIHTAHPNTNWGGLDFDMELKRVHIAQNSYTPTEKPIKEESKAGLQQVEQGENKEVYHTVKKGDTVWALVNKTYKSLGTNSNTVMANNPNAFGKKGDFTTLKIGAKLFMGVRK